MVYKKELKSSWGELFGLDICTLTEEQLSSIDVNKVVEFLDADVRIEKILVNRINQISHREVAQVFTRFKELDKQLVQYPELYAAYNTHIRNNCDAMVEACKGEYYLPNRSDFVVWDWLDDKSRDIELSKYAQGESSVVNDTSLDYKWLYDNKNDLAMGIAERVMKGSCVSWGAQGHLLATMPEEMIDTFMTPIFKGEQKKNKEVTFHVLQNPNTPHRYVVRALRNIGTRKKNVPKITVPLGKKVWKDIPSITRLNILESIMYWGENKTSLNFDDIKSEEEMKELLFSCFLRYYNRVERLLKTFDKRYCVPQIFEQDRG